MDHNKFCSFQLIFYKKNQSEGFASRKQLREIALAISTFKVTLEITQFRKDTVTTAYLHMNILMDKFQCGNIHIIGT